MEHAASLPDLASDDAKVRAMQAGANWFIWISILGSLSALIYHFYFFANHLVHFGLSEYVDARAAAAGSGSQRWAALAISLGIAGVFALFGYFARKGSDLAFIVGMFIYFFDAVILLGYREFFAFGFHLVALFFIAKGLLASRRRYDPSVDATGA